ncbi:MAG TPA: GyrI-like domain-containing protein [Solirubrobacteraceae bacterium]|jgi:effector-binding domain-containing protein|nr:GyrI-like domain-containing protein [Solirubrobacteraceae bacterium]
MPNDPEIRELDPQPVAFKRASTDAAGMRETIDGAFGALFAQLGQLGVTPTDVPYIRYLKTGEELEIELGVPVAANGTSLGDLEQASLPGGRAAVLRYVGPYEDLQGECERLNDWVEQQGEGASGPHWESYVTNPAAEPDPNKRITDIYLPLA